MNTDEKYCIMCGHYKAIPYTNTKCSCECHDEESK